MIREVAAPPSPASSIRIRSIAPVALEMPLARTVETPIMPIRSLVALLVAVEDDDGVEGWGEVWCNFPRFGIHHRARLLTEFFAPALAGRTFASPGEAWAHMHAASHALRLQSGEPGPIAAAIAGIDIALHDIVAKRAGQPLWRWLGGSSDKVRVYASLGRADHLPSTVERCLQRGFRAIKLRSSGAIASHVAAVRPIRALVGEDCELMLDVNSSWEAEAAIATIAELAEDRLSWLEEPISVDAPADTWLRLAAAAPMPLAGGENMIAPETFDAALSHRALRVLQPDITKWGGFTGGLPLSRRIVADGRRLCPHLFAGAPGVLASAHLLAASDSPDGLLEYGVGPHPARDGLLEHTVERGELVLGDAPGLGLEVNRQSLKPYLLPL